MARTKYSRAIDFDPTGWTIPDLFDEYTRCAKVFWKDGSIKDLGRIFVMSQPSGRPPKKMYLARFRDVAQVVQMSNVNAVSYFEEKKGERLNAQEKDELSRRVKYAKVWLSGYAPKGSRF